jgi:hypothetical protein
MDSRGLAGTCCGGLSAKTQRSRSSAIGLTSSMVMCIASWTSPPRRLGAGATLAACLTFKVFACKWSGGCVRMSRYLRTHRWQSHSTSYHMMRHGARQPPPRVRCAPAAQSQRGSLLGLAGASSRSMCSRPATRRSCPASRYPTRLPYHRPPQTHRSATSCTGSA